MKIILITIGLALALFANAVPNQNGAGVEKLNYSQQQEMLRFLKQKINNKDYTSAFELGLVYENGLIDPSGKVTKYPEKAKKFYILAYDKGDYRSIFKIIPLLVEKKKFDKVLEITQTAIDNSTNNRSLLISATSIYATTVMDNFLKDRDKLVNALFNVSLVTDKELNKVPTLKFIKANLMNMVGDTKVAERLLNEACFSKNTPEDLKKICMDTNNFLIAKDDVKKSIDECVTCSLIEK